MPTPSGNCLAAPVYEAFRVLVISTARTTFSNLARLMTSHGRLVAVHLIGQHVHLMTRLSVLTPPFHTFCSAFSPGRLVHSCEGLLSATCLLSRMLSNEGRINTLFSCDICLSTHPNTGLWSHFARLKLLMMVLSRWYASNAGCQANVAGVVRQP